MKSWLKKVVNNQKTSTSNKNPNNQDKKVQARVISFNGKRDSQQKKDTREQGQEETITYMDNQPIFTIQIARRYEEEVEWTDAQAQIINQLINMDSLIKFTRKIEHQYIMLMELKRILCSETISIKQLKVFLNSRTLPYQYYPVRALMWKVALGYLPPNKQKWISFMEGSLLKYQTLIRQLIVQTVIRKRLSKKISHKQGSQHDESTVQHPMDHPLNCQKDSKWKNYFEDYQLWNLIEQDTIRTRQTCNFFHEEHLFQLIQQESDKGKELEGFPASQLHLSKNQKKKTTYYYDSLTRILFIFCKQHPEVGYWQGMNQIAAIIYYCFTNKNSQYFRRVSQSDAYFVLCLVMEKLGKKHFASGQRYATKFMELLQKVDHRLCQHLAQSKINLSVMTIRWFLALFLNQFEIDQCLLFWDGIVGAPESDKMPLPDFVMYFGLAVVHLNRQLIVEEGSNPLQLFSKINHEPRQIIDKAMSIYKLYQKVV